MQSRNKLVILALTGAFIIILGSIFYQQYEPAPVPIDSSNSIDYAGVVKVGIIHSLSGTMASSEIPVLNATLVAIDEINSGGGILDKKIVPIIYDGASHGTGFSSSAKQLLENDDVNIIFGGWTSASRKSMIPIIEQNNAVLFYPLQYEGLESNPNVVYLGASPNQQVIPVIEWATKNIGTKIFLVGSDYIFPHSANQIISDHEDVLNFEIVGEKYELLGARNFTDTVSEIKKANPDLIVNTLNGDSNRYFFNELRKQGITSETTPTVSLSLTENQVFHYDIDMEGDYLAWNYFSDIPTTENKKFIATMQEKLGNDIIVNDPMESAYTGVYLYALAAERANSFETKDVLNELKHMTFQAPEGIVLIDPNNNHLFKTIRIAQINSDGGIDIIYSSEEPVKPNPYPETRTIDEWNAFVESKFFEWEKSWENKKHDT